MQRFTKCDIKTDKWAIYYSSFIIALQMLSNCDGMFHACEQIFVLTLDSDEALCLLFAP